MKSRGLLLPIRGLLVMLACVGSAASSPMLSPYATRLSVSYDGGYRLELAVCGKGLCTLTVMSPKGRTSLPKSRLAGIVDPDIRLAVLFIDPSSNAPERFSVEIPLSDFERNYYPRRKIVVMDFSDSKLIRMEETQRDSVD